MLNIEKTVFISYRRTNIGFALAIHQNLTARGYDVFFDYDSIKAGDFEQIILRSIESRAHFVVILTPSALERCAEPGDWLRREIEHALEHKRNIIPLTFEGFDFQDMQRYLPAHIAQRLGRYNGLRVPTDYFNEAMNRLTERFNIPLEAVLHPPSLAVKTEEARQQRLIVTQPTVNEQQLSADEIIEQGVALILERKYTEALAKFEKALVINPKSAEAYACRARAQNGLGNNDEALKDIDRALELQPDTATAYYARGNVYRDENDYDRAIADYTEAIRLNPDDVNAYNNRGNVYYDKGDYDRAIADYNEAIRLNPDNANAYNNRGNVYYNKGDYDRAIADYNEAIRLNPDNANAYYNRGAAYDSKGDYDRAISDYDRALATDPNYKKALRNRENALRKKRGG